jgi:hypothetical protein
MSNPEKIIEILSIKSNGSRNMKILDKALIRYCSYDKRKRLNFWQLQEFAFA